MKLGRYPRLIVLGLQNTPSVVSKTTEGVCWKTSSCVNHIRKHFLCDSKTPSPSDWECGNYRWECLKKTSEIMKAPVYSFLIIDLLYFIQSVYELEKPPEKLQEPNEWDSQLVDKQEKKTSATRLLAGPDRNSKKVIVPNKSAEATKEVSQAVSKPLVPIPVGGQAKGKVPPTSSPGGGPTISWELGQESADSSREPKPDLPFQKVGQNVLSEDKSNLLDDVVEDIIEDVPDWMSPLNQLNRNGLSFGAPRTDFEAEGETRGVTSKTTSVREEVVSSFPLNQVSRKGRVLKRKVPLNNEDSDDEHDETEKKLKMAGMLTDTSDEDEDYIPEKDTETDDETKSETGSLVDMPMHGQETPSKRIIKGAYDLESPSPKKRKKVQANEKFFETMSALLHYEYSANGDTLEGKPITIQVMRNAILKGKKTGLLKGEFKPENGLSRYVKNGNKVSKKYRGCKETGFEELSGGVRKHSKDKKYCPFSHCEVKIYPEKTVGSALETSPPTDSLLEDSSLLNRLDQSGSATKALLFTDSSLEGTVDEHSISENSDGSLVLTRSVDEHSEKLDGGLEDLRRQLEESKKDVVTLKANNLALAEKLYESVNNNNIDNENKTESTKNSKSFEEVHVFCEICNKEFTRGDNLKRHLINSHNKSESELNIPKTKIECSKCGQKMLPQCLKRHQKKCLHSPENQVVRSPVRRGENDSLLLGGDNGDVKRGGKKPRRERDKKRFKICPFCLEERRIKDHVKYCKYMQREVMTEQFGKSLLSDSSPKPMENIQVDTKNSEEEVISVEVITDDDHVLQTMSLSKGERLDTEESNLWSSISGTEGWGWTMDADSSWKHNPAYPSREKDQKGDFVTTSLAMIPDSSSLVPCPPEDLSPEDEVFVKDLSQDSHHDATRLAFRGDDLDDVVLKIVSEESVKVPSSLPGECDNSLPRDGEMDTKDDKGKEKNEPRDLPIPGISSCNQAQSEKCEYSTSEKQTLPFSALAQTYPPPGGRETLGVALPKGDGDTGGGMSSDQIIASKIESDIDTAINAFNVTDGRKKLKLLKLIEDLCALKADFANEEEKMEKSNADETIIRELLYRHSMFLKGEELENQATPKRLSGIHEDYYGKLKVCLLPYLRNKYGEDFSCEWFIDFKGKLEKPGVSPNSKELFLPTKVEIRDCVQTSYSHLDAPAGSQKMLVVAINKLFDALNWTIDQNEEKFGNSEIAEDKIKKIWQLKKSLEPLRKNLHKQYLRDKVEKKNEIFKKNPHKKNQVADAIFNFNKAEKTKDWKLDLQQTYKKVKDSPKYVPDASFMVNCVNGFFNVFLSRCPLRPKAVYDMPLKAIILWSQDVMDGDKVVSGVNLPINWDKVEDINRYIYLDKDLLLRLLMFIQVRNRYFSTMKDPSGSNEPEWYLNEDLPVLLNSKGRPHEKIELKEMNTVSKEDMIIPENEKITAYDCRRDFTTHLHYHEDEKMGEGALSAAGHGGKHKSDVGIFNDFYDNNQAKSATYVQTKLNQELNIPNAEISEEMTTEINSGMNSLKKKMLDKREEKRDNRRNESGEELLSASNPVGKRVKRKFNENVTKIDPNWKAFGWEDFKLYKSRLLNIILHDSEEGNNLCQLVVNMYKGNSRWSLRRSLNKKKLTKMSSVLSEILKYIFRWNKPIHLDVPEKKSANYFKSVVKAEVVIPAGETKISFEDFFSQVKLRFTCQETQQFLIDQTKDDPNFLIFSGEMIFCSWLSSYNTSKAEKSMQKRKPADLDDIVLKIVSEESVTVPSSLPGDGDNSLPRDDGEEMYPVSQEEQKAPVSELETEITTVQPPRLQPPREESPKAPLKLGQEQVAITVADLEDMEESADTIAIELVKTDTEVNKSGKKDDKSPSKGKKGGQQQPETKEAWVTLTSGKKGEKDTEEDKKMGAEMKEKDEIDIPEVEVQCSKSRKCALDTKEDCEDFVERECSDADDSVEIVQDCQSEYQTQCHTETTPVCHTETVPRGQKLPKNVCRTEPGCPTKQCIVMMTEECDDLLAMDCRTVQDKVGELVPECHTEETIVVDMVTNTTCTEVIKQECEKVPEKNCKVNSYFGFPSVYIITLQDVTTHQCSTSLDREYKSVDKELCNKQPQQECKVRCFFILFEWFLRILLGFRSGGLYHCDQQRMCLCSEQSTPHRAQQEVE